MYKIILLIIALVILAYAGYTLYHVESSALLPTQAIDFIGMPHKSQYHQEKDTYSRNIWDIKAFNGKLFFGAGNSSNSGPSRNAGPVDIISYNPDTNKFSKEGSVDEEQIDIFRIIDQRLYIPGHDATQSWKLGNFYYRNDKEKWQKIRNIPGAIHVYDMIGLNGSLFAALGTKKGAAVALSKNQGKNWQTLAAGNHRGYSFLRVKNQLYIVKSFSSTANRKKWKKEKRANYSSVYQYDLGEKFHPRRDLIATVFFPNTETDHNRSKKIVHRIKFGEAALYIGAYKHNDHQSQPFSAYVAYNLQEGAIHIEKIPIAHHYQPWDISADQNRVYLLLNKKVKTHYRVSVLASKGHDLSHWTILFTFELPTFARSFEKLADNWYFGLGSDIARHKKEKNNKLHPSTGVIARIKTHNNIVIVP